MKLSLGLAAALASCATAAQQAAQVYMLPALSAASIDISPSLARLILLQRLAPEGKGPSTADIPDGTDAEKVAELMNRYGGHKSSLFDEDATSTAQLVIMLEGMTEEQMNKMGKDFSFSHPAFAISNPPSSKAHDKLIENDFYNAGVTNEHKCSIKEVTNPFEKKCWSGRSTVAKYNVKKQPEVIDDLVRQGKNLEKLSLSGEMETTFVLLPASGEGKQWSDKTQELRRRQSQSEQVISAYDKPAESDAPISPSSSTNDNGKVFYASTRETIPACFKSKDACESGTGGCSGRGECQNKYAKNDGSEGKESCYVCHCKSTSDKGSVTHWAGPTCAKKDISTPFWLFAGFTLVMVGVLSMSIGLLFSVGAEKLPGVIGAGVSKGSK